MLLDKLSHYYQYLDNSRFAGIVVLLIILTIGTILFNFIKKSWLALEIKKIVRDTLKKGDTYSRTSLTMFSSFWIANYFAMYDFIKNGFNFEVFAVYITIATGLKGLDILDKKYNGQVKIDNSGPNGTSMNVTTKKGVTKKEDNKDSDNLEEPVI